MKNLLMSLVLLSGLSAQAANTTAAATATKTTKAETKGTAPAAGDRVKIVLTKDNMLVMNDIFEDETVANLIARAKELDGKLKSNDPLFLVIKSPGGSIDAGIELIENLNNLNHTVHTLTIFSASMGFQTVQGIKGKRLVLANGTLMSHKARGSFSGEFPGQLDSRYAYYLNRVIRLDKTAAARTGGKHTLKSYQSLIENEYWCDGDDCIKQGFADYIANASCDASLNGKHNKLADRFMYMGHIVEIIEIYSDCALNSNPLNWNIMIDGEPLFANNYDVLPEKWKAPVTTKDSYAYTSYDRPYENSLKEKLGLETVENIKKLVSKRLDARSQKDPKEVRKY